MPHQLGARSPRVVGLRLGWGDRHETTFGGLTPRLSGRSPSRLRSSRRAPQLTLGPSCSLAGGRASLVTLPCGERVDLSDSSLPGLFSSRCGWSVGGHRSTRWRSGVPAVIRVPTITGDHPIRCEVAFLAASRRSPPTTMEGVHIRRSWGNQEQSKNTQSTVRNDQGRPSAEAAVVHALSGVLAGRRRRRRRGAESWGLPPIRWWWNIRISLAGR